MSTAFNPTWFSAPPSVILDVGTFDAADAVHLKQAFPGCRVVAFEACPDNVVALDRAGVCESSGVELMRAAVCAHDGVTAFHSNTDRGGPGMSGSILAPTDKLLTVHTHLTFKASRVVPAVRLDTFCEGAGIAHVDLLHVDAQGAEHLVLRGLGALRPALVYLEVSEGPHYAGATSADELHATLVSLGYTRTWCSSYDALYRHAPGVATSWELMGAGMWSLMEADPRSPGYERTVCGVEIEAGKHINLFGLERALTLVELTGLRDIILSVLEARPFCADDTDKDGDCARCARLGGCPVKRALQLF